MKPSAAPTLPFTVIGGFLGAGKTTMLNRLLENAGGTRFAVLINDFGALNIDERLVTRHDGETIALANGCMCCSMAGGFISALSMVMDRAEEFDQLVVEASGVSNPRRIMDIAKLDPGLSPNGSVVLVDASQILSHLQDSLIEDAVTTQLREADILVINKIGLANAETLEAVTAALIEIHPGCPTVTCDRESLDPAVLLGGIEPLNSSRTGQDISGSPGHEPFRSCVLSQRQALDRDQFNVWAESLPPSVLRGKGFVVFSDDPDRSWLWQKVGRSSGLELRLDEPAGESAVVLIGSRRMPAGGDPAIAGPFERP